MRVCPKCSLETMESQCPQDGARTIPVSSPAKQTYPMGTIIADRYRIDGVIGIGGFGAVYKCTQLNMDQTVAVKVLRADHLSSSEHVKRFSGEAQAVSRLRHPNTIRVFDFGTHTDGALYLAMEYVEGETLGHRFDTKGALPWTQLVHILVQVCHSLTEAHASGLVHRDLKPENVMLLPVAGDPDFVKVLDFGIAKQQNPADMEGKLTEAGMIMGTPTYMSPEQAKGETIDGRSDVYALGILAYEALVGRPPFLGDTPMTVLVKHIKDPVPAFIREGALREVPRPLEALVQRCLAKDRQSRPQTTAELADELTHILENARRPLPAAPALPPAPESEKEKTTRAMAAVLELPSKAVTPRAHTLEAPPPPPSRLPLAIAGGAFVLVAGVAAVVALTGERQPSPTLVTTLPPVATVAAAPTVTETMPPSTQTDAPPAPTPTVAAPTEPARRPLPPPPAPTPQAEPKAMPAAKAPEAKVATTKPEAVKPETVRPEPAKPDVKVARPEPKAEPRPTEKSGDRGHNHEAFRLDDEHPDTPKR